MFDLGLCQAQARPEPSPTILTDKSLKHEAPDREVQRGLPTGVGVAYDESVFAPRPKDRELWDIAAPPGVLLDDSAEG